MLADLADTLELLAERGAAALATGELARALVAPRARAAAARHRADLAEYRVIRRRPVTARVPRARVPLEPAALVRRRPDRATGCACSTAPSWAAPGSAEAIAALVEVMREQARARDRRFARELYRGGLARRL